MGVSLFLAAMQVLGPALHEAEERDDVAGSSRLKFAMCWHMLVGDWPEPVTMSVLVEHVHQVGVCVIFRRQQAVTRSGQASIFDLHEPG